MPTTCPPRTFAIQVRMAMRYLGEIREREAMLDWVFAPVEEKYTLLTRHAMVVSAAIVSGGEVHLAHQAPTPCTSLHPSPPLVPSHSTLTPLAHRTPLTLLTDLLLRPPHPPHTPTPTPTPHPTRYEVRMPKEESDTLGDLRFSWRKLKTIADALTDKLRGTQVGLTYLYSLLTPCSATLYLQAGYYFLQSIPRSTPLHVHRRASVRVS